MSVWEPMLKDEQWEQVRPLIPPNPLRPKGSRPPADDRACFEGILRILKPGTRWKALPDQYPHPSTCWRRLRQWYEEDVLKDMWRAFLSEVDQDGILEWDEVFYVAERAFTWITNYRRIVARYENHINIFAAFFRIARAMIALRKCL
jgi:transposase